MPSNHGDKINHRKAKDQLVGKMLESGGFPEHLKGKPVHIPQMNFTMTLEQKVKSMLGPPEFALRARRIEESIRSLGAQLVEEYVEMIDAVRNDEELFVRRWREHVESVRLDDINHLIEKHNRFYPIEANLRIDPYSHGFLLGSNPWEPKEKLTRERLFNRFPPDLAEAKRRTRRG